MNETVSAKTVPTTLRPPRPPDLRRGKPPPKKRTPMPEPQALPAFRNPEESERAIDEVAEVNRQRDRQDGSGLVRIAFMLASWKARRGAEKLQEKLDKRPRRPNRRRPIAVNQAAKTIGVSPQHLDRLVKFGRVLRHLKVQGVEISPMGEIRRRPHIISERVVRPFAALLADHHEQLAEVFDDAEKAAQDQGQREADKLAIELGEDVVPAWRITHRHTAAAAAKILKGNGTAPKTPAQLKAGIDRLRASCRALLRDHEKQSRTPPAVLVALGIGQRELDTASREWGANP